MWPHSTPEDHDFYKTRISTISDVALTKVIAFFGKCFFKILNFFSLYTAM